VIIFNKVTSLLFDITMLDIHVFCCVLNVQNITGDFRFQF